MKIQEPSTFLNDAFRMYFLLLLDICFSIPIEKRASAQRKHAHAANILRVEVEADASQFMHTDENREQNKLTSFDENPAQVRQARMHRSSLTSDSEQRAKLFHPDSHTDVGYQCRAFTGVQASYCESMIGEQLASHFSKYKVGRTGCHWDVTQNFWMRYWRYGNQEDFYNDSRSNLDLFKAINHYNDMLYDQHEVSHLQKCKFVVSEGHWYVERIGPFRFQSNSEWLNIWHRAYQKSDLETYISGSMLGITDDDGDIVPYPPVHMHHFHLWKNNMQWWGQSGFEFMWTETHADSGCLNASLGAKCYMQVFPEGEGIAKVDPKGLFFDALANLVGVSFNKSFFFDISLLCRKQIRHVVQSFGFNLPLMDPWPYPDAGTYDVPPGEHIAWSTQTVPVNMSIVWQKWHLHADFHDDVWIYFGTPQDLGLEKGGLLQADIPADHQFSEDEWNIFNDRDDSLLALTIGMTATKQCNTTACRTMNARDLKSRMLSLDRIGLSLIEMKNILNERVRERGLRWFAKLDSRAARTDVVHGEMYERRPLARVLEKTLLAGTDVTTIAFLKSGKSVRSHTSISLIFRSLGDVKH